MCQRSHRRRVARVILVSPSRASEVVGAQTVSRALSVLGLLRQAAGELGVTEISRALTLNVTTVHRLLRALVAEGYVAQNPETDRYLLGRESYLLGLAAERTLGFAAVTPLLEQLCLTSGESTNLVVRDGVQGMVVLRVESQHPLRFSQPAGSRIPLHCTSSGKVLLAFAEDPRALVEELGELDRLTDRTVTSRRALLKELREIRERGFALNQGERHPGVAGAAAPVMGEGDVVVAALAVQGPDVRMPHDRLLELGEVVVRAAADVADALPSGYRI